MPVSAVCRLRRPTSGAVERHLVAGVHVTCDVISGGVGRRSRPGSGVESLDDERQTIETGNTKALAGTVADQRT